ncbi:ADP-ribosyltransferase [Methanomicrobium mobile]|uniref:ADP-ribosyltransferase n=1 Tax=Methanomicrobium mobile TaxID=2205 RepID=UPI0005B2E516|nr:ADP-ribosyltransferase [Methanomicrobium mobile]
MEEFDKRTDELTTNEISALKHYRDLNFQQYNWSINLEKKRPNTDCDVINGYLRGDFVKSDFPKAELKCLKSLIRAITRAINKSGVDLKKLTVYKGVGNFKKLKKYAVGKTVIDKGFSSFSTSEGKALEYSGKNSNGENIIFLLKLKKRDKAIYLDEIEDEWLIQKHSHYLVMDIRQYVKSKIWGKAIVYYLRLT